MNKDHIQKVLYHYSKNLDKQSSNESLEQEKAILERFIDFITTEKNCFERSSLHGHITASALLLNKSKDKTLLTLHKKLNKWLQVGGHADGCTQPEEVALKEAYEESGLVQIDFFKHPSLFADKLILPIDLDIHHIPEHKKVPPHLHYDIRYVLVSTNSDATKISSESIDLRWFSFVEAEETTKDTSLKRLLLKVKKLLQQ